VLKVVSEIKIPGAVGIENAIEDGCVFSTGVYISSFKVEPVRIGRVRMFLGVSGTADDD
jgi:hypothetical protein